MSFEQDVQRRANEKVAGIMDTLGDLIGNNGSLSTPLTALGGAALGGMAGHGLGMGGLGIGLGAALGGALGGVGANAINSQNMYQNMNDAAMINGISAGLNANDQTDMMQNQAIAQTNDTVNQLVGIVGDMMQGGMAMGGGMMPPMDQGMDPAMMGADPSMMGGQPPMDQGAMMPPPSAPMAGQVDNNGLGMKQGSYKGEESMSFEQDVINRTTQKLASLCKTAEDDGGEMQGATKAWTQNVPETSWFENLANSAPVSNLLDFAEATGVDRWADSMNEFAGNIGTSLGNLVGSMSNDSTNLDHLYNLAANRMDVDPATTDFGLMSDDDKLDAIEFASKRPSLSQNQFYNLRNDVFAAHNKMGIPNSEVPSGVIDLLHAADPSRRDPNMQQATKQLRTLISQANNFNNSPAQNSEPADILNIKGLASKMYDRMGGSNSAIAQLANYYNSPVYKINKFLGLE